jgi:hypothetical protein
VCCEVSVRGIPGSELVSCRDDFHIGFDSRYLCHERTVQSLTRLYRYYHGRDTFLFVVLGSYRTSTGVIETLTQTRPWWHHVNKPDSLEQRYKSSTDKAPQDDVGTVKQRPQRPRYIAGRLPEGHDYGQRQLRRRTSCE